MANHYPSGGGGGFHAPVYQLGLSLEQGKGGGGGGFLKPEDASGSGKRFRDDVVNVDGSAKNESEDVPVENQPLETALDALRDITRTMQRMMDKMDRQDEKEKFFEFMGANPPAFLGTFDPSIADGWIKSMEKIFVVVPCSEKQKVSYATYMLEREAEYWWHDAKRVLEATGLPITWQGFKTSFYEKYIPQSVKNAKEIEFLQLKQGKMTVLEYTYKFEELIKFSRMYLRNPDEWWKCIMYENGLKPEINIVVAHLEIREFATLANKCQIVEESQKKLVAAQAEEHRSRLALQAWRFKPQTRRSPFQRGHPHPKGNQQQKTFFLSSRPAQPATAPTAFSSCPKCGKNHGDRPCLYGHNVCYKCGKPGHMAQECNMRTQQPSSSYRPQS